MRASAIIATKDLRLLLRDPIALFWVVAFPLGFALFFGSVMKAGVEAESAPLPVVLVLESRDPQAEALAHAIESAGLRVWRASRDAATAAVRRGDAVAFVRIRAAPDAPIELGIDPSHRSEVLMLTGLIRTALAPPSEAELARIQTTSVSRGQHGPRSGFDLVFPSMLIWGLLGCAATFAISLVSERNTGTLLRLRAAPVSRTAILGGKSLACAIACIGDVLLLSALGTGGFGVRIDDVPKYIAAIAACTVCFSGLTMVLSVIGKTEQAVAGAGWATLLLLAMVGGAMVPVSIMPAWLVPWSDASPVHWGILALEGATWRELSWRELVRPLSLLVAFGVTSFIAGVSVLFAMREV
jgi:ABC-2 type transport system permease protein